MQGMLKGSVTRWWLSFAAVALAGLSSSAHAQSGMSGAVSTLPRTVVATPTGTESRINARLFGGRILATITDRNGDPSDFAGNDMIRLVVSPERGTAATALPFRLSSAELAGTRAEFEAWARQHSGELLALLFPGSLSSSALGRDTAQVYSQQFLLSTVLGADAVRQPGASGRFGAGGMVEPEWFSRDNSPSGYSGRAWQGLYDVTRSLSVQGRFADQREDVHTRALTMAVDYHPYVELNRTVVWRVGGLARSGVTYSKSVALDPASVSDIELGSLDFGGGGWASAFKDLGRTRVGGGAIFQGTKNHVPTGLVGDDLDYLATAFNGRGIDYDLSYGASLGFDTSPRTTVLGKFMETRNVSSDQYKPAERVTLVGLAYRTGALRFSGGYRNASAEDLTAHAVFFRGNFDW